MVDREMGHSADNHYDNLEAIQAEQAAIKIKTNDFKEGFKRLYEATGTTNVNDIIIKYVTQDETIESLESLKRNYTDRIQKLSQERNVLKDQLSNLKYEKEDT
jgi:cell division protein FtsB